MLDALARKVLDKRYTIGDEDPEDILKRVARLASSDKAHENRLLEYFEKNWVIPASPILSNLGRPGALPVSCFLMAAADTRERVSTLAEEVYWMGSCGGGVGVHLNDIRTAGQKTSRGSESSGVMPAVHMLDALSFMAHQGGVRRGSQCIFLPVWHPEFLEFLRMKLSAGDEHRKGMNLNHSICINNHFLDCVKKDLQWDFVDPHSGQVLQSMPAREVCRLILEVRCEKSQPFIVNLDACNDKLHPDLKEQGMRIQGSNLCQEIVLPTASDYSNICVLSSPVVEHFDEWSLVPEFIPDIARMLDNVINVFIDEAPPQLWRAIKAAQWERSIGIGQMGWHSYLQKHMVPFESPVAIGMNKMIAKHIHTEAWKANEALGLELGPADGLKTHRFAHTTAIAPNETISIVAGCSPSVEPWDTNYFVKKNLAGANTIKNKYLDKLIQERYESSYEETWLSVRDNRGSARHLDRLTQDERNVFKVFSEINQHAIVKQALDRQEYVDQAQSINLSFPSNVSKSTIYSVHMTALMGGLKTLYYCHTDADPDEEMKETTCTSCEG